MDWIQRMNRAIAYIEDNLTGDIDYKEAAQIACCSVYHFQRMFSYILDVPLSEYIRHRRLTLAAFELQNSDLKVIDIALKYGYDSPDAFGRAFSNLHGITPKAARDRGVQLKAYPRISFHISIKGDVEMNYRFVDQEAYRVFGKSMVVGMDENPYEVVPKLWEDFQEDGTYQRICRTAGFEPYSGKLLNAAVYDFDNSEYKSKYIIFTALPENTKVPEDLEVLTIPSATWVAFSEKLQTVEDTGKVLHALWKRIYAEWLPTSGYHVTNGPQLEIYPDDTKSVEIWIPVVKNNL